MTEPDRSPPGDELTQRYREASAQDTRRPGAHVREAVRAHAQMVIAAGKAPAATDSAPTPPAANQSRWKISALAGLALAGLTGLLVLQYDRGTDEEKDLAFGQPSASAPPAPAPAAAPAAVAPPAAQAENRGATTAPAQSPAAAAKAPTAAAPAKPRPQHSITGSAAPKAQDQAAPPPSASAAPSPAPSPAPLPAPSPTPAPAAPPPPAPEIAAARESPALAQSVPQADAAMGGLVAPAPAARAAAPAPAAPAAAAPAAVAPEQKREKLSAPSPLRAEAPGAPRLAGALQNAARAGDLPQVERLLQQGAALNAADAAGRTPLMLAAMQGHTAVVQRLLAAGANTALTDHDGLNAQQHARRLGYDGIAHLIAAAR